MNKVTPPLFQHKWLIMSLMLNLVLTALIVFIGGYKTNFFNRNLARYGLVELNPKQRRDYYCIKGWNNSFAKLGVDFDVVFFGNSITAGSDFREYFPEVSICNLGYPGDEIDGMILRIPAIQGVHPKKLFVMAGINGLKQMSEEVFKDIYKSLIMALKDSLPGTQIYLQSILPVNNTDFKEAYVDNGKIEKANNIIKDLANKNGCDYINLYDLYVRDGQMPKELSRDGLHLRPEAYSIWAEAIRPYMR